MTHYKPYPAYKDSGVEWLGRVPEHWDVVRLRRITAFAYGDSLPSDDREHGEVPVYGSNGQVGTHSEANTESPCIIIGRKGSFGKLSYSHVPVFAIDTTYFVDRRYTSEHMRWLFYGMQPLGLDTSTKDSAIPGLAREDAYENRLLLPPEPEQLAIATFLDRETARIDALIEKKQRLIELLKEKRQALITQAVTKGLDPKVPMKDSGVEWLGEVPAHWSVMTLRHALTRMDQGKSPECEGREAELDEWGVLKTGCVNGGVFWPGENKALPPNISPHRESEVKARDLLMSRASGSVDLIGSAAYVDSVRPRLLLSDKIFRLNVKAQASAEYISFVLGSIPLREQIKLAINGAEGLANNITKASIRSLRIGFPPKEEQEGILIHLQKRTAAIRRLIERTESSLSLLKEHRSALITAAVTGQIDLRDLA